MPLIRDWSGQALLAQHTEKSEKVVVQRCKWCRVHRKVSVVHVVHVMQAAPAAPLHQSIFENMHSAGAVKTSSVIRRCRLKSQAPLPSPPETELGPGTPARQFAAALRVGA